MNNTEEEIAPMTTFRVLHDDFADRGPFSGPELKEMIDSGEISETQEVEKVSNGKVFKADYAIINAEANDRPPSPPTKAKFFIGIGLLVAGISAAGFIFYAMQKSGEGRGKLFLIPAIMAITGIKMITGNVQALKA